MVQEGKIVSGVDMSGNPINNGTVTSILNTFGVAIVKVGEDRTHVTHCHVSDLTEQEEGQ
jgi:hypothetical protein